MMMNQNESSYIQEQEKEATEYASKIIKSHGVKPEGEEETFGVQGFWQEMVLNYLKTRALVYVGHFLKNIASNYLVDFSEWLLDNLENYVLDLYSKSNQEEKDLFKQKIQDKFPNSNLLKLLK